MGLGFFLIMHYDMKAMTRPFKCCYQAGRSGLSRREIQQGRYFSLKRACSQDTDIFLLLPHVIVNRRLQEKKREEDKKQDAKAAIEVKQLGAAAHALRESTRSCEIVLSKGSSCFSSKNRMLSIFTLVSLWWLAHGTAAMASAVEPWTYEKPYWAGQEKDTYGSCENINTGFYKGSKLCCEVQNNYQVTCCRHPKLTGKSYCSSFSPLGMLGVKYDGLTAKETIQKARDNCTQRTQREIATEARLLLQSGPNGVDSFEWGRSPTSIPLSPRSLFGKPRDFPLCNIKLFEVDASTFPILVNIGKELAEKFFLSEVPIMIYDDSSCDPSLQTKIGTWSIEKNGKLFRTICISYQTLLNSSDSRMYALLGHEAGHLVQAKEHKTGNTDQLNGYKTSNNIEVEADIFAVLGTRSSCNAIQQQKTIVTGCLPFTEENLDGRLQTLYSLSSRYPAATYREFASALMSEFYESIKNTLLG